MTDRFILRTSVDADAVVFRQLWAERDVRVPPHGRGYATEAGGAVVAWAREAGYLMTKLEL